MKDLFRETVFGRLVHLASGGLLFKRDEELDPSTVSQYSLDHSESSSRSNFMDLQTEVEKGKDKRLVEWSENDPHNPRNWSTPKKAFVTFQICLLTTSVYIGSAIYTAGIPGVQQQFHVSEVKALLGLTLFVLGYALGPMVWVRRLLASNMRRNRSNQQVSRRRCRKSRILAVIPSTSEPYLHSSPFSSASYMLGTFRCFWHSDLSLDLLEAPS